MLELLAGPFIEFGFMRRALAGCIAVTLGAVPTGVFLLLRRMSLIGDVMAHAILPGVAAGYLLAGFSIWAMTIGGLLAGVAVALAAGFVARKTTLKEDASLASFYLISLALGVALISLKGGGRDLLHVLFGNIFALDDTTLMLLGYIATFTLLAFAVIYRPLVLECVDPAYLGTLGRAGALAHYGLLLLVVLNLVAGFNALGTLLAVGMIILPAAIASFWCQSLAGMLATAMAVGVTGGYLGLLLSFYADLPGGPAIILTLGCGYFLSILCGSVSGLLSTRRRTETPQED